MSGVFQTRYEGWMLLRVEGSEKEGWRGSLVRRENRAIWNGTGEYVRRRMAGNRGECRMNRVGGCHGGEVGSDGRVLEMLHLGEPCSGEWRRFR